MTLLRDVPVTGSRREFRLSRLSHVRIPEVAGGCERRSGRLCVKRAICHLAPLTARWFSTDFTLGVSRATAAALSILRWESTAPVNDTMSPVVTTLISSVLRSGSLRIAHLLRRPRK